MNRYFYLLCAFVFIVMSAISCKSNEKKAADLIEIALSKTLLDFGSYEPIETTVSEAYETAYNDKNCIQQALATGKTFQKVNEYIKAFENAKEHMDIWGRPSYYSSTYSDNQYYKYKRIFDENLENAQQELEVYKLLGLALQDSIKNLNPQKRIGWEVNHRFRCRNRGGNLTIADYRYIIDEKFKNVIFSYDIDDDDYSKAMEIIKSAESGGFDKYASE